MADGIGCSDGSTAKGCLNAFEKRVASAFTETQDEHADIRGNTEFINNVTSFKIQKELKQRGVSDVEGIECGDWRMF